MRMNRRIARQIGDLNEQIRIALGGLPLAETDPRIRVRQSTGDTPEECELWGYVGMSRRLRRLCRLPAGVGLRTESIEKAATNAGFAFSMTDAGSDGWRRVQVPDDPADWFEFALVPSQVRSARAPGAAIAQAG